MTSALQDTQGYAFFVAWLAPHTWDLPSGCALASGRAQDFEQGDLAIRSLGHIQGL